MGSDASAIWCTGVGAVFAGVAPFGRLTLFEGVTVERGAEALASCRCGVLIVLAIGRLALFEGVAEECEAEPLAVCFKGVEITLEAEPAGRVAMFEGVIEEVEVEPFTIPLAA
jgi:hypothetical protein